MIRPNSVCTVRVSTGSSGNFLSQIENGAPFDVFLSADAEHMRELEAKNLLVPGSRSAYADGVLAREEALLESKLLLGGRF